MYDVYKTIQSQRFEWNSKDPPLSIIFSSPLPVFVIKQKLNCETDGLELFIIPLKDDIDEDIQIGLEKIHQFGLLN